MSAENRTASAEDERVERDRFILQERLGERLRQVEHYGGAEVVLTLAEIRAVLACLHHNDGGES